MMTTARASLDQVARAVMEAVPVVCGRRVGGDSTVAPIDVPGETGWMVVLPVPSHGGQISIWFEQASAEALARALQDAGVTPEGQVPRDALVSVVAEAGRLASQHIALSAVRFGDPVAREGLPASGAWGAYLVVPNVVSVRFAVGIEQPPARDPLADDQLAAVLNVSLPLAVRFGRVSLPLQVVADLGPGSLVDLGRPPDAAVDVLVGERVVARGEVVVVGGQYGVRITELVPMAGTQPAATA